MLFLSVSLGVPFHEVRQWSAAEIVLYQCFYKIAPWGEERADLRNAMSMQMTANMHRDPSKRAKPFEYTDFMPFFERPKEQPEQVAKSLKTALSAFARRKKK
jgi:hypothetical protein